MKKIQSGHATLLVLSAANTRHLDGKHTVFGKIVQGLDVMHSIAPNDVMTNVRVADAG